MKALFVYNEVNMILLNLYVGFGILFGCNAIQGEWKINIFEEILSYELIYIRFLYDEICSTNISRVC